MIPRIAIVADDLTGAADTAAGTLAIGQPLVTWASEEAAAWRGTDTIVAVDAKTRHVAPDAAAETVRAIASRFRAAGFGCLFKKVDSTLRGHVAVEVSAALDGWHAGSLAVVAPAFPAMGRTTRDGRQHVHGAPLAGPSVYEVLAAGGSPVGRATLDDVRGGRLERLLQSRSSKGGAVVCDALTDLDLQAIAAAGVALGERVVWVGSGGLARNMFGGRAATLVQPGAAMPATGPVLIVCGSRTELSASQAARVAADGARNVRVTVAALTDGAVREATDEVERRLRAGDDVVVTIDAEESPAGETDPALAERLGLMLAPCRRLTGGLIATGGDTASAVLRHWGIRALRLIAEAEAGVPIGRAEGGPPLLAALKAGGFGNADTLAVARAAVRSLR
jgi:4-hydroxythreonine-4-phosphate dehydrogenase